MANSMPVGMSLNRGYSKELMEPYQIDFLRLCQGCVTLGAIFCGPAIYIFIERDSTGERDE